MTWIERRAFRRVPCASVAHISGPSGRWRADVVDISVGGLCLDSSRLQVTQSRPGFTPNLAEHAMVSIDVDLPRAGRFHAFARVRWQQGSSAFGAEFVDLDPKQRATLLAYVEDAERHTRTASHPPVDGDAS